MVGRGLPHDVETPCPCTTIALEYVQSCSSPGRITSPHSDIVCQGYIALVDVVLPLRYNARRPQYSRALATVCQPPISGRTPSNCHAESSYRKPHGGLFRMGNGPRRVRGPLYGYVTIISPAEHNAALLVYSTYHFKIVSPQLCTASDALCVDLSPKFAQPLVTRSLWSPSRCGCVQRPPKILVVVRNANRSENATGPLPAQSRYLDIPQCANATHIKRRNHMRAYGATRRPRGDWRARHPFQRRTPFEPT